MELFTPYYILADIMLSWGLEPWYCTLINMTIALHNSRHWIRMLTDFYYPPGLSRTHERNNYCIALLGNRVSFFFRIRLCRKTAFKRTVTSRLLYRKPNVVFHCFIQFLIFINVLRAMFPCIPQTFFH